MAKVGLSLHPSKCKAQTNQEDAGERGERLVEEGLKIEVLKEPIVISGY